MNALPLVAPRSLTLAESLREALDGALSGEAARCVWCASETVATVADRWSGRVVLRCPSCGSELEGAGRRRGREARG